MKQVYPIFLILILAFLGCTSIPEISETEVHAEPDEPQWVYNFHPNRNKLYFLGISSRLKNRDDEYEKSRQFAAIQAALNQEAGGRFKSLTHERGSKFGRKEEGEIFYDPESALLMYETLQEECRFRNSRFTAVLYSLETEKSHYPGVSPASTGKTPEWINTPPKFPGFYTGVAMVESHRTFENTIQAADNRVLRELLSQKELRITGEQTLASRSSNTRTLVDSENSLFQGTSGSLYGFYILARWEDPQGRLYSLGICPMKN